MKVPMSAKEIAICLRVQAARVDRRECTNEPGVDDSAARLVVTTLAGLAQVFDEWDDNKGFVLAEHQKEYPNHRKKP